MAALLAAMGVSVYFRVGGALMTTVDQQLHSQATEAAAHARERTLIDPDVAPGPTVAQLLDGNGRVLRSTPPGVPALVDRSTLARVAAGVRVLRTSDLPGEREGWRVLAQPLRVNGATRVLVVARSLQSRHEALQRLLREFLIAGPIALLLASLAGYGLAAAALRPVESMRRRVQDISASTPGRRLPVPPARDEIHRLAETLNEMLDRLEAAFEHERRFVADASHELRTPLALLRTELELALRKRRTREELEAAIASAVEDTERLTRLAEDLLLIARSDQGGLPIRRERVDAGELLRSAANRFAVRAREHGRTIDVSANGNLVVDADPRAPRAGARQPDRQRAAARRGTDRAVGPSARPARRAPRHRCRPGLPARLRAACVRPLQPSRRRARRRQHGARALDRRPDRAGARRRGGGRDAIGRRRGRLDRRRTRILRRLLADSHGRLMCRW